MAIFEQVSQYCTCVEEITEKDVSDMIDVVSLATGWMLNPCETFELSDRREVIDLPSCMDCPYTFTPYYAPFDPNSFRFTLITRKGIEQTMTPIEGYLYTGLTFGCDCVGSSEGDFRIETGIPKCKCGCTTECGCPTEYKLLVEYRAGYEDLPDCLLPVMCNLLEVIHAKNSCDCNGCGCDGDKATYDADGNIITQEIKYKSGDVVSVFLETDLGKMLVEQYKNLLGQMSLLKYTHNVWGCVV